MPPLCPSDDVLEREAVYFPRQGLQEPVAIFQLRLKPPRQRLEAVELLAKAGVQGIRSHMVLPPRNEVLPGEMKQRIKEGDYDSVLVIRPKASRKETEEVVTSVSYVPPPGYYTFGPYWNLVGGQFAATESYFKENTVVTTEFNLYNIKDEKLLWSGEAETVYSDDFEKLAKQYAGALMKQLKKDKVIEKK
jgi:hypothetical protein